MFSSWTFVFSIWRRLVESGHGGKGSSSGRKRKCDGRGEYKKAWSKSHKRFYLKGRTLWSLRGWTLLCMSTRDSVPLNRRSEINSPSALKIWGVREVRNLPVHRFVAVIKRTPRDSVAKFHLGAHVVNFNNKQVKINSLYQHPTKSCHQEILHESCHCNTCSLKGME